MKCGTNDLEWTEKIAWNTDMCPNRVPESITKQQYMGIQASYVFKMVQLHVKPLQRHIN